VIKRTVLKLLTKVIKRKRWRWFALHWKLHESGILIMTRNYRRVACSHVGPTQWWATLLQLQATFMPATTFVGYGFPLQWALVERGLVYKLSFLTPLMFSNKQLRKIKEKNVCPTLLPIFLCYKALFNFWSDVRLTQAIIIRFQSLSGLLLQVFFSRSNFEESPRSSSFTFFFMKSLRTIIFGFTSNKWSEPQFAHHWVLPLHTKNCTNRCQTRVVSKWEYSSIAFFMQFDNKLELTC